MSINVNFDILNLLLIYSLNNTYSYHPILNIFNENNNLTEIIQDWVKLFFPNTLSSINDSILITEEFNINDILYKIINNNFKININQLKNIISENNTLNNNFNNYDVIILSNNMKKEDFDYLVNISNYKQINTDYTIFVGFKSDIYNDWINELNDLFIDNQETSVKKYINSTSINFEDFYNINNWLVFFNLLLSSSSTISFGLNYLSLIQLLFFDSNILNINLNYEPLFSISNNSNIFILDNYNYQYDFINFKLSIKTGKNIIDNHFKENYKNELINIELKENDKNELIDIEFKENDKYELIDIEFKENDKNELINIEFKENDKNELIYIELKENELFEKENIIINLSEYDLIMMTYIIIKHEKELKNKSICISRIKTNIYQQLNNKFYKFINEWIEKVEKVVNIKFYMDINEYGLNSEKVDIEFIKNKIKIDKTDKIIESIKELLEVPKYYKIENNNYKILNENIDYFNNDYLKDNKIIILRHNNKNNIINEEWKKKCDITDFSYIDEYRHMVPHSDFSILYRDIYFIINSNEFIGFNNNIFNRNELLVYLFSK